MEKILKPIQGGTEGVPKRIERLEDGKLSLESRLFGYDILAEVTLLKEDVHVLLTGGSLPHTGAVSMYCDGREDGEIQPEGHRDKTVSDRWSRVLSAEFHCRVTTVCGIHYDHLTKDEITRVVSVTDEMLAEAVQKISDIRRKRHYGKKESQ